VEAPTPSLRGQRVTLRPATADDRATLLAIFTSPGVPEWWRVTTEEQCRALLDDADVSTLVVELDGTAVGLIQFGEESDPEYRHASIDIAIHGDRHHQGLGTDALRTLARHLLTARGHHRITIDPAAANTAAIGCYTKVGFRPVGILRRYERGLDGTFHDGLLMDLLAGELT
jgi:aminoglycoside 6'-N-acetyltransferase